jgi:hypothetical protein
MSKESPSPSPEEIKENFRMAFEGRIKIELENYPTFSARFLAFNDLTELELAKAEPEGEDLKTMTRKIAREEAVKQTIKTRAGDATYQDEYINLFKILFEFKDNAPDEIGSGDFANWLKNIRDVKKPQKLSGLL